MSLRPKALQDSVEEIERHLHHYSIWFETAASPSGETHVADRIGSGGGSFQIDAGNDDWGSWVQLIGSEDTPVVAGGHFDPNDLHIDAAERTATYFIQIACGESGAAAFAANTYSDCVFTPQSVQGKPDVLSVVTRRQQAGTKVWARCMCPSQNTATLNLYIGIHEYTEE